ncbi:hypothetical protein [Roseobacter sp.]|uniref:hypothetical protein n=1 Tax=Roseobacter sp. TaxID=1907202 RepID=UPI00385C6C95
MSVHQKKNFITALSAHAGHFFKSVSFVRLSEDGPVMTGRLKRLALAAVYTVFASAASAQGVLYDCDVTEKKKNLGWISNKVAIVVAEDGQASVSDSVILYFAKRPMAAQVDRNNAKKLNVSWTLKNVVNAANQVTPYFDYTAQINKRNMRFSIYAQPENYPNRFSGKGSCTLRTGK